MSKPPTTAQQWETWFASLSPAIALAVRQEISIAMGAKEPAPVLSDGVGGSGLQLAPQVTHWLERAHNWRPEELLAAAHQRCTATPFTGESAQAEWPEVSPRPPFFPFLTHTFPFTFVNLLHSYLLGVWRCYPSWQGPPHCYCRPTGRRPPTPFSAALVCEDCLRAAPMQEGRQGGESKGWGASFETGVVGHANWRAHCF